METIQEEQKIIIKYLREKPEHYAKVCYDKNGKPFAHLETIPGNIIGCVLAIGKNIIGWSLINNKDRQWVYDWNQPDKRIWESYSVKQQQEILAKNKELAFHIAYNRAMYAESMDSDALIKYYSKIPVSITDEINKISERSEKYFK